MTTKYNARIVRFATASAFALCAWAPATTALAATSTGNLDVSATVASECAITTTPLAFGAYSFVGANVTGALNGTGSVILTCTTGPAPLVTLGIGANTGGGTTAAPLRRMASAGSFLAYFLYSNAIRTTVWADTVGSGLAGVADGTAQPLIVYGVVTGAQNVPAGAYTDTVIATVTF